MKKKTQSDFFIALAVVLSSALLLAALYFTLAGAKWGEGPTLQVDLPSVTGLRPHSQVRYAGNPVGRIVAIETLPWEQRSNPEYPIRVTVRLHEPLPTLKTDSYASINADTILAEKFLDIAPGTVAAPPLAEGQPVPAAPGGNLADLMAEGGRLLADVRGFVAEVRQDYPALRERMVGTLAATDALVLEARAVVQQAEGVLQQTTQLVEQGSTVADSLTQVGERVEAMSRQAESLVVRLDSVAGRADQLLRRFDQSFSNSQGGLQRSLGHLRGTLENLTVTSTYLRHFSEEISRQPWRLIWGNRNRPDLPTAAEILQQPEPSPTPRR